MFTKKLAAALIACSVCALAHTEEVKIGSVSGITGPIAHTTKEGLDLTRGYFAMVNAHGGINGNKITLVTRDDQYDPRKTAGLVEDVIVKDDVVALVNSAGTANTMALIKTGVLNKYKVPLVGVFSGSEAIRGAGSEYIFHTRPTYHDEVMKIARLVSTLGLKKVAVLYQDDVFGAGIIRSVEAAAQEHHFEIVLKSPYKPGNKDFSSQAKQIIAAHPSALLLMGVPDAVNQFMKVYDAPRGASQIFALSFVTPNGLVETAGEERVRGVGITQVVPNPNAVALPLAKDFQAFLKTPYGNGVEASPLTFEFYLNVRLALEAIRMAGPKPTAEKVAQSLRSMHNYRIDGYPIDFSETKRRGSSYLDIAVVGRNGKLSY